MTSKGQSILRYAGGLALVLGVHAAAIIIVLNWPAPEPVELPQAAMMVELPPLPEPPAPPPPPRVVQPQPTPVEEPPLPKLAEAPKPKIAVPKPEKPKPKPKPQPKPVEKKPEPPKDVPEQVAKNEPAESEKAAAPKPQPPQPSAPPADSQAKRTWQSDLLAHLGKYKRYPDRARSRRAEGTVLIEFTLDANGKVLDAALVTSSGNSLLDDAAIAQVHRASPMPKPPAELLNGKDSIKLKAPFNFNIKDAMR